ncbi:class I SAM-dependent methyltransferase [Paraburkholderia sediminicola]|uniref:methyltransferase domain-containing protein n=1 Tax=Paraburkholderia sediminicola TaxID=458836 RepID=UPI0038BB7FD2
MDSTTEVVTQMNFCEAAYLDANPDVAAAVEQGALAAARLHFDLFGKNESHRRQSTAIAAEARRSRRTRIEAALRQDMPHEKDGDIYDFLTPELREQFNIIDTANVSSNQYDGNALALIEKHRSGLILDCGAGSRPAYFENVVNFEIAAYPSTDVRGVGEVLPFKDKSFDAVFSMAVLEHVKDPFLCAREIIRVLKPGGELMCCVPLLQPVHGYPHHYYNMTAQGLANLFGPAISVDRHEVPDSVLPIWSLTWILNSWAAGLSGDTLNDFRNMKVSDLMDSPADYLSRPFVRELSKEKNMELASATVIFGTKR